MNGLRVAVIVGLFLSSTVSIRAAPVRVGSKSFTESYVLSEIAVKALQEAGFEASHRPGMGGTIVLWQALRSGGVDAYPDYTGTIAEQILGSKGALSWVEIRAALAEQGIGTTRSLGFNNTYALVMRQEVAGQLGVEAISDLRDHPGLRVGLTHEFIERRDGWRPLSEHYGLAMTNVRGVEHSLAYPALSRGDLEIIDAYSTDAKLAELDLVALRDDRSFFPRYEAVFLYRLDLIEAARDVLRDLEGSLDEPTIIRLNAIAEETRDYAAAASEFLGSEGTEPSDRNSVTERIGAWTLRHLQLVTVSLGLAILVGIPLGVVAARPGALSQSVLGSVGVIYTIPSLALLAVLAAVPFLGISGRTAIVALFLYSLLPIVRNTATGLRSIPIEIRESAIALGLEPRARLSKVFLPMALPTILAGIKTSAVINVATATLAALIGAGGLGEPIISGLNLNDPGMILQGALPAAALALLVQLGFDLLERGLVSRGLRLDPASSSYTE